VGPGKRAVAAFMDVIPALTAALVVWYDVLIPFAREVMTAWPDEDALRMVRVPAGLLWADVTFRVVYMLYGMVFEMVLSATPGKRLVGCEVRSESLDRPTATQVVIRNLTKLVELEHRLLIWPFVLVVFFTRNRQRVGDLLARTIVVERQAAPDQVSPNGPDSRRSNDGDWT
jgi:uncharacterized RDD family membrane protein YckC